MNNGILLASEFERKKNLQAAVYTLIIGIALLLILFFATMTLPEKKIVQEPEYVEIALPEPPPVEDVNLGNSNVGSGDVQPIVTGTPSSAPSSPVAAPSSGATTQQASRDFDEDDKPEAPPITKPATANTNKDINTTANNQSTVAKPDPRPRAVMTSPKGSGNGGNTDLPGYNRPGGQGLGDGAGDKGTFNGNPRGTNFGVKMVPIGNQSFEDDFNQNAKVAMLVEVDAAGKVTSATHTSKGSTGTATRGMIDIARRRAFQVKFSATGASQKGTLIFDFAVR